MAAAQPFVCAREAERLVGKEAGHKTQKSTGTAKAAPKKKVSIQLPHGHAFVDALRFEVVLWGVVCGLGPKETGLK